MSNSIPLPDACGGATELSQEKPVGKQYSAGVLNNELGNNRETFSDAGPKKSIVSVKEYRKILGDYTTPDHVVIKRIEYIEALSRNVVRGEISRL